MKVPIIVVACNLDLQQVNQQVSLEKVMQQFPEIETSIACSASKHLRVSFVHTITIKFHIILKSYIKSDN